MLKGPLPKPVERFWIPGDLILMSWTQDEISNRKQAPSGRKTESDKRRDEASQTDRQKPWLVVEGSGSVLLDAVVTTRAQGDAWWIYCFQVRLSAQLYRLHLRSLLCLLCRRVHWKQPAYEEGSRFMRSQDSLSLEDLCALFLGFLPLEGKRCGES